MKELKFITVFLILANLCFGADSKESAKINMNRLTINILVADTAEIYKTKKLDGGLIYDDILGDVLKNLTSSESLIRSRGISREYLEDNWVLDIQNILRMNDSTGKCFTEVEKSELLTPPASSVEYNLNKNLGAIHASQRNKAVAKQGVLLNDKISCTLSEDDIEKLNANELQIKLVKAFSDAINQPLYEENKINFSTSRAKDMVADGKSQWKNQLNIVGKSSGGSSVSFEGNQASIKKELGSFRSELRSKVSNTVAPFKVYGEFSSVNVLVPKRADTLTVSKFTKAIRGMSFPVDKSKIVDNINKDISGHVSQTKSLSVLKELFGPEILEKIIESHSKDAEVKYRSSLKRLLGELLTGNDSCKNLASAIVSRSVTINFYSARKDISGKQFGDYFEPLKNGTWIPSDSEVETYHKSWNKNVNSPLKKRGISSSSVDESRVLDETKQLVEAAVNLSLVEGSKAYSTQDNLVDGEASVLKNEIKSAGRYPSYNLTVEIIEANLFNRVKTSWAKASLSGKYKNLFPSIVSKIKKAARTIVDVEVKRRNKIKADIDEAVQMAVAASKTAKAAADKAAGYSEAARDAKSASAASAAASKANSSARDAQRAADKSQAAANEAGTEAAKNAATDAKDSASKARGFADKAKGHAKDKADQEAADNASQGLKSGDGESDADDGNDSGPGGSTDKSNSSGQSGSGSPGSGGPGTGKGQPEKKGTYKPDLIIDLDVQGNAISVNMRFLKDPKGRGIDMSYKFLISSSDPDVILSQMGEVRTIFERWFSGNARENEQVSLFIAARIMDGKVSYGSVISLRRCIESTVKKLKKKNLKIYWYDDYYKREYWQDKDFIPEIFKKKFRWVA